ncbi:MAG: hypothetical protein OXE04_00645 [bacterium]|nr:hypothetical protein [bacterium]
MSRSTITGLIAICDSDEVQGFELEKSYQVSEFAQLTNGDIVLLRDDRGWTESAVAGFRKDENLDISVVVDTIKSILLPDEDLMSNDPHPWEDLVWAASQRGLAVTVDELKNMPYRIYVSERIVELSS